MKIRCRIVVVDDLSVGSVTNEQLNQRPTLRSLVGELEAAKLSLLLDRAPRPVAFGGMRRAFGAKICENGVPRHFLRFLVSVDEVDVVRRSVGLAKDGEDRHPDVVISSVEHDDPHDRGTSRTIQDRFIQVHFRLSRVFLAKDRHRRPQGCSEVNVRRLEPEAARAGLVAAMLENREVLLRGRRNGIVAMDRLGPEPVGHDVPGLGEANLDPLQRGFVARLTSDAS